MWDLFDDERLQEAEDYSEVREELGFEPEDWEIREYFDENRSIQELAFRYFDHDLEEAWNFIEDYDGRHDGLTGASDYDEVYDILFPESDDEEEEDACVDCEGRVIRSAAVAGIIAAPFVVMGIEDDDAEEGK